MVESELCKENVQMTAEYSSENSGCVLGDSQALILASIASSDSDCDSVCEESSTRTETEFSVLAVDATCDRKESLEDNGLTVSYKSLALLLLVTVFRTTALCIPGTGAGFVTGPKFL